MAKENDQLPVIQQEASEIEQQILSLEVTDEASLAKASDTVKIVKDLYKRLETDKKRFTAPANEIISAAKAKYDPILKALKGYEDTLKGKAATFLTEKKRLADEKIAKLGARVEKGTMRLDTANAKMDEIDTSKDVRTESSGMRMQTRKDVEVSYIDSIPAQDVKILAAEGYLVWDMVKVRKDALAGIEITGVKIIEKQIMQSI